MSLKLRTLVLGVLGAGMLFGVATACSGEERPEGAQWTTDAGSGGSSGNPCKTGETKVCGITLGEHEGVLTCYQGSQTCSEGVWGECTDGKVVTQSASSAASTSPQAFSAPGPCINNPCDPYCQNYNETPDSGLTANDGGAAYTWPTGSIVGYPAGLVSKGLKQPCSSGADCQFNSYCEHPVTSSTCEHDKCLTGGGLTASCDPCVTEVCAADPSCCKVPYVHSCNHDPCVSGNKLKTTCDPCVANICAGDPYCCNTAWDSLCVGEINTVCGLSCPLDKPGNWSQACVDKVDSVCQATCGPPAPPSCAHDVCTQGSKLAVSCHSCVSKICISDPYCCDVGWDAACVAEVPTACGQSCPVNMQGDPPSDGTCRPWLPGQTDPNCPGIDLSGGVPCDSTIPVCNHGNTTAPAGVRIIHFPANSNQYPKCAPDQTHPEMYQCFTSAPIPPGECISVTGCPGLTGNREIMINPPGTASVAECSCKDNWTLYSGGTCAPPSCASGFSSATYKPLNLYFTVDRSSSLAGAKWTGLASGLKKFFADPSTAGLGAALEFYPLSSSGSSDGCPGPSCAEAPCANPLVAMGTLAATLAPTDAQEQNLIAGVSSVSPSGNRPTFPALDGALDWAVAATQANTKATSAVVLVSGGDPTACNTSNTALAALAATAYNTVGVRTHVIGISGANMAALDQIAAAGGTGKAIAISGTDAASIEQQLIAALHSVATTNVPCSFDLPDPSLFDETDVSVTFTSGAGATSLLPQVTSAADCGSGGWYYDNNAAPTQVILCSTTCSAAKSDPGSSVSVNVGCPKIFVPTAFSEPYQALCPDGTAPLWGYFSYDTVTPSDSAVVFKARTATTQAGLASATYKTLAVAQANPNTQVCPLSGPSPCPVDLYLKLGIPDARYEFLELQIVLNPSTDQLSTPTINGWQLIYSCPPSE